MSKLILLLLVCGVVCTVARHIHPGHHGRNGKWKPDHVEIDGMSVDTLRKIMSSNGYVPVNNIVYFRKQEPCEEGLQRDLFGICREVWDD